MASAPASAAFLPADYAFAMPASNTVEPTRAPLFPAVAPAILALADGTVFRGSVDRCQGHAGRRGRVQHVDDRATRRSSPTRATRARSSRSRIRTSATSASMPRTSNRDVAFAAGLVIRDLPRVESNFRSTGGLDAYLAKNEHRRDRRHRHAEAHAAPSRKGRAERLHPVAAAPRVTPTPSVPSRGQGRRRRWRGSISRRS